MRHLFIVDPMPQLAVTKDTSVLFMREATVRGHEIHVVGIDGLSVGPGGRVLGRASRAQLDVEAIDAAARPETTLSGPTGPGAASAGAAAEVSGGDAASWYALQPAQELACDSFDVVWMRKDPPVDLDFLRAVQLLALIPPPTLVVNAPEGLLAIDEKLFVLRFPDLAPPTRISRHPAELLAFREELGGEMILKPIGGCGGEGVFHLRKGEHNLNALLDLTTEHGQRYQIGQKYLPEIRQGDKRVIVLDGEPVGAVLRVPKDLEARANFHAGGSAMRAPITPRDREICQRIGPSLRERGILFAGIDVIGDYLTEINVTSPTGLQEINALDGVRVEADVLDAVEARVASARPGGPPRRERTTA